MVYDKINDIFLWMYFLRNLVGYEEIIIFYKIQTFNLLIRYGIHQASSRNTRDVQIFRNKMYKYFRTFLDTWQFIYFTNGRPFFII